MWCILYQKTSVTQQDSNIIVKSTEELWVHGPIHSPVQSPGIVETRISSIILTRFIAYYSQYHAGIIGSGLLLNHSLDTNKIETSSLP